MESGKTNNIQSVGLTVLRVIVGTVFLVHGLQKLFLMGFGGVSGMMEGFGLPAAGLAAVIVTLVELLGGAALILGLFTRLAAILLSLNMLVAILVVHLPNGFFAQNGGYEFAMVLLASGLALTIAGPGAVALDRFLATRTNSPTLARLTS